MAKQRYVNTHFWDDSYIEVLKPMERYLFIYFLTNPHTNICGIYELSIKRMVSEAGLPEAKIRATLNKFSEGGKIYYLDGWVYVKNFVRHQSVNPKIVLGIENKMKEIPSQIINKIKELLPITPLYIETELLEPELESKPKLESVAAKPPPQIKFFDSLSSEGFLDSEECIAFSLKAQVAPSWVFQEARKFVSYWREKSPGGKKERWEKEKVFDPPRRLGTWLRKAIEWQSEKKAGIQSKIAST